tara:strand:+ start:370 stop:1263 length:894 start_codon:yes stop_codon:yes gene_type:complete
MEFKDFKKLQKHTGSKNYIVKEIISKNKKASYIHFDSINQNLVLDSYLEDLKKENNTSESLKIDKFGNIIDSYDINTILENGTMWDWKYYSNWILNGDKNRHNYSSPLSEDEKNNAKKWVEKFKDLYLNASFVYIYMKDYYFKIDNDWYLVEAFKKAQELDLDIKNQFPPKIDESEKRMIELQDITPDFYIKKEKRDTRFMRSVGYEEFDSEEGEGINPINYSAGWHYIELYMPQGDTIKFKRFGSMGVNIETYRVPKEYGGREDVIFIVQEPNELYPNMEYGGMYVVRPRELSEKE